MERTIVDRIRTDLVKHGAWVLKIHGSAMQVKGIPDLLCCWRGRFVGLEAKQPGEHSTPLQSQTQLEIRRAGGIAGEVTSVADVQKLLAGVTDMCAIQPLYQFNVKEERIEAAQRSIGQRVAAGHISKEKMFEVLMEMGWGDSIGFDPKGPLEISTISATLTDLQWCAFAAAVAAAIEGGCQLVAAS